MNRIFILCLLLSLIACSQEQKKEDRPTQPPTDFEDPPQWSSEVVWYQIFVERFRNGDPSNDPTVVDLIGTYPGVIPEGWQTTPWTWDWYRPDPYWDNLENARDFFGNPVSSFGQKSQLRRYGGDLQGVLDQLDYLDSLGITAVYFNPVNDAPSLHKYDSRYWHHVDRNFGPDPRGDAKLMENEDPTDPANWVFTGADKMFLELVEQFHKRGIRVIMDYSWNHTGHTFWAWRDILEKQEDSEFADWYWITRFDDPDTEENEFAYHGWAGVHDLPEIRETDRQDLSEGISAFEGDIYSREAKEHIYAVTRRWLDPNGDGDPSDGVDGFRLDVAVEVPLGFWREYRKIVREVNPDAYLVGEVWWQKWPDKLMDPEPYLKGDIFDSHMNYRWYRAARHFFNAAPDTISVSEFVDSLNSFRRNIRNTNVYAMMNLAASHDAPRVLTSLFNKNMYKYNANPFEGNNYKIHKPDSETYQTLRLLLAHQFTYIGAPHIWAGDEMGMWGSDDPSCRKPLIWPDHDFEPESTGQAGFDRPVDQVEFNTELFSYYREMIRFREENPVLVNGDIDIFLVDDEKEILGYSRSNDSSEIICIFNISQREGSFMIPSKYGEQLTDHLTGASFSTNEMVTVGPRSALLLHTKK